ncbi:MAG: DegV family protein [Niameybacter sp.]|uniref:DegV family protein n=1 Tax=Niameybacter sp. TaxID=2033640 RepID=UPI002FCAAFBC
MNKHKIALLVDSCIDVPQVLIDKYGMYTIPLKIIYSDGEYSDGVDITADEVYAKLKTEIPKTSLPSGTEIIEKFDQIKANGYEKVLAVTLSSGLSGTHNLVTMLSKEYEGLDIRTIDTLNIGIAGGFNAIQAAEFIEAGMPFEELVGTVERNISKVKVFFCVDTLEYLQKGGRIGLVASILGNALNLKPIISCNDEGIYYNLAKVRGRKKSLEKIVELAKEFSLTGKKYNIAVCHGGAAEEAEGVKVELKKQLPNIEAFVEGQISPALGVHTGPGLIGVAVQIIE